MALETENVLRADTTVVISLAVSNIGSCTGHESVQLYVSAIASSVFRPALELQGFEKVRDLKPGETRKVQFTLDKYAVSYYDEKMEQWCATAGKYRVSAGSSVEDLKIDIIVEVPTTFYWTGL